MERIAMAFLNMSGTIALLRVHEVGTGFGPSDDKQDVEVVFKFDKEDSPTLGFPLRNDDNRYTHDAMLALLRDAFNNGWTVHSDYEIADGKQNGRATRIWLTRDRPPKDVRGDPASQVFTRVVG
jgi:hypothetical protein